MSPQVPAVSRAAAILRFLSSSAVPVSAPRIADAVGVPRSSTYHLLSALQAEGFVMHLPDEGRYLLGLAVAELGSTYSQQASLSLLGHPLMAQLVRKVRHPVHLGLLHGPEVLYIVEQRPPRSRVLVTEPQVQLPAHLTASGRAMLALLPPSQVTALFTTTAAFTGRTGEGPKSLPALRRVLADERAQGFSFEREEVTLGMSSVAVACLDRHGRPAASVAMTYPASRRDIPDGALDALRRTAYQLSVRIGFPGT